MTNQEGTRRAVRALLDAVESRDLRLVGEALAPEASWQNVPHPATVGRKAVVEMLTPILTWSDHVRWDVISQTYGDGIAWVERVDRFVIDGVEHAVRCNGVFLVDANAKVSEVRDYVDLGEWRMRVGSAFGAMADKAPVDVVQRHIAAVRRQDIVAMAADYATDAELLRGGSSFPGREAIIEYFSLVPQRLHGRRLELGEPRPQADGTVVVRWTITEAEELVSSGSDTYSIVSGRITRQIVTLDGNDF